MSQYTSTQTTPGGTVVNVVLNTVTNTQTITVTSPNGATATVTQPGTFDRAIRASQDQLIAQGVDLSTTAGISGAILAASRSVLRQQASGVAVSDVTGNPPPAESAAIPVSSANNPNTTPAPSVPPIENSTPQPSPEYTTDSLGNSYKDGVLFRATEVIENEQPATQADEFAGIDEQVAKQKQIADMGDFAGVDEAIAKQKQENTEYTTDSLGNSYKDGVLFRAAEVIENPEPLPATGYGNDPGEEYTTDSLGNSYKNGVLFRAAEVPDTPQGITTDLNKTRSNATRDDSANFQQKPDWRARLSLSPGANYLYKVPPEEAGILKPLQTTDGVIFPYTPAISVTYSAGYDASELIHSNYKIYQYKGSSVDTVSITADFTAQDTTEANYLLAVIHFFRSVTKMFYGQDKNPNNGVPPPLCYLSGFGAYTYDAHPVVITNFTYATPTDVDYIRAGSQTNQPGVNISQQKPTVNSSNSSVIRKSTNGLSPKVPNFSTQNSMINSEATYIPTKLQLQITCIPIVTRNDISNKFSLKEYATGELLRGSKRSGGGIW